jgi:uncharacterized membrane protein
MEQTPQRTHNNINVGMAERYISLAAGAFVVSAVLRRALAHILLGVGGAYLIYRGLTGHDVIYTMLGITREEDGQRKGIKVSRAVTVNKPVEEVYRFWRNFENLPLFMEHLESVTVTGGNRSHWVAKAPLDRTVEWDAEITDERQNESISWRSVPGSDVENMGTVRFHPASGGRGTEVHVALEYSPPGGSVGAVVAKLFGEEPDQQIREDLRHFKQVLETGETPPNGGSVRQA